MYDGVEKCLLQVYLKERKEDKLFMHASTIQAISLAWSKACLIISKSPAIMTIVAILAIVLTLHGT